MVYKKTIRYEKYYSYFHMFRSAKRAWGTLKFFSIVKIEREALASWWECIPQNRSSNFEQIKFFLAVKTELLNQYIFWHTTCSLVKSLEDSLIHMIRKSQTEHRSQLMIIDKRHIYLDSVSWCFDSFRISVESTFSINAMHDRPLN